MVSLHVVTWSMTTTARPLLLLARVAARQSMRNISWLHSVRENMSNVIDVTKDTFRSEVIDSDKLVVVDFWAEWCGPCKKLSPLLDEIAAEIGDDVTIAKINVDEERELGAMFQVMSITSVLLFKNGEKVDEFIGLQPKPAITSKIQAQLQ